MTTTPCPSGQIGLFIPANFRAISDGLTHYAFTDGGGHRAAMPQNTIDPVVMAAANGAGVCKNHCGAGGKKQFRPIPWWVTGRVDSWRHAGQYYSGRGQIAALGADVYGPKFASGY